MVEDMERFEGASTPPLPEGLEARLLQRLAADAEARAEATLERVGAGLQGVGDDAVGRRGATTRRAVLREPVTWLFGLGIAAIAATVTFFAVSARGPVAEEAPAAFVRPVGEAAPGAEARVTYDARGRVGEIAAVGGEGERVLFRAGRVIRIEHLRGGQLDGVAVDFDADGGVIAVRTWARGVEVGAWIELDGRGRVTAQGER